MSSRESPFTGLDGQRGESLLPASSVRYTQKRGRRDGRRRAPHTPPTVDKKWGWSDCTNRSGNKKGQSPSSSLALLSVDARRTPAENVWRPASTTDRRYNCLLLTQDAGCLKGSKKPERSEASRPPLCSDPSFGKRFTYHLRGASLCARCPLALDATPRELRQAEWRCC